MGRRVVKELSACSSYKSRPPYLPTLTLLLPSPIKVNQKGPKANQSYTTSPSPQSTKPFQLHVSLGPITTPQLHLFPSVFLIRSAIRYGMLTPWQQRISKTTSHLIIHVNKTWTYMGSTGYLSSNQKIQRNTNSSSGLKFYYKSLTFKGDKI